MKKTYFITALVMLLFLVPCSQTAEEYYNNGVEKGKLEDYKGAIADYSKAIEIDPNYAWAYYNRGIAKDNLEDYRGAIADYNKI